MEDLNQNATIDHSPNSTQNINKEKTMHAPIDKNNTVVEGAKVEETLESIARETSKAAGSRQAVKTWSGSSSNYEVNRGQLSLETVPPPGLAIQPYRGGQGVKRGRGRPRGSGKLQMMASGRFVATTAGGGIMPHVVNVNTGEDVVSKILSFCQRHPMGWAVSVLSANGPISSVVLRQPDATKLLTYEGHFNILSLTGSCSYYIGAGGENTKNCELTISLVRSDGGIFGGNIERSLIAASPIKLILATFKLKISNKIKKKRSFGSSAAPSMSGNPDSMSPRLTAPTTDIADNPISEITNAEAVPENAIPADQNMHSEYSSASLMQNN